MIQFSIIVACCKKNGIGHKQDLPWKLKTEMAHFRKLTSHSPKGWKNVVIMGRNTWESIPSKYRPLVNRYNIILTSKEQYSHRIQTYRTLDDALEVLLRNKFTQRYHRIFIIGGDIKDIA